MGKYDNVNMSEGMYGLRNGWSYRVCSIVDDVAHCHCLEDDTFVDMSVSDVRALANSGELNVLWPPTLRWENLDDESSSEEFSSSSSSDSSVSSLSSYSSSSTQ